MRKWISTQLCKGSRCRVIFLIWFCFALILIPGWRGVCRAQILRLADRKQVNLPEMIKDLRGVRVVLIGEEHNNREHHRFQLDIIKALAAAGARVTIGLEMFRADSQPALDSWVAGELQYRDFMRIFHDNWGGANLYDKIFWQGRENKWPMLGLNLSRQIVNQVARRGFASLSEEQLAKVPVVQCIVDESYMQFIRRALGQHRLPESSFVNFCEAQMLWDAVMAKNIGAYLADHPKATVVVLCGFIHAWKHAIPTQLQKLGVSSWRVVLPYVPELVDLENVSAKDLDYLIFKMDEKPRQ